MKSTNERSASNAGFDVIGQYDQNAINGFNADLLEKMFDYAEIDGGSDVIDAMAGNGNLTQQLFNYCIKKGVELPHVLLYEYSRVQSEIAKTNLANKPVKVITGDILKLKEHSDVPRNHFDRVLLKSANHEIPQEQQQKLYENIYATLKPGGKFVNLGMVFDNDEERKEVRAFAHVKDTEAGMWQAVENRHFLLEDEFYSDLKNAGFSEVLDAERFQYNIKSEIVAKYYFKSKKSIAKYHQQALDSRVLRQNFRMVIDGEQHIFMPPGRITVSRKPSKVEENISTFKNYPIDFLRHIRVHSDLLDLITRHIHPGSSILDVGCGTGLLLERLLSKVVSYEGIDIMNEYIHACRERFLDENHCRFYVQDVNSATLSSDSYDHICLVNIIHIPGIEAIKLIRKAYEALSKDGTLIISGPVSKNSFTLSEPIILQQLENDGFDLHHPDVNAMCKANKRLLTEEGNYWNAEGMAQLLLHCGFESISASYTDIYNGFGYMLVAKK
ncbi:MAG: class I SAM-dependent methyltransferase [Planctomycetes bacterium]|nr:class I SAM-dependent methyltransferase [Planctomycetota bacterium]